jgi:hypothetical protein
MVRLFLACDLARRHVTESREILHRLAVARYDPNVDHDVCVYAAQNLGILWEDNRGAEVLRRYLEDRSMSFHARQLALRGLGLQGHSDDVIGAAYDSNLEIGLRAYSPQALDPGDHRDELRQLVRDETLPPEVRVPAAQLCLDDIKDEALRYLRQVTQDARAGAAARHTAVDALLNLGQSDLKVQMVEDPQLAPEERLFVAWAVTINGGDARLVRPLLALALDTRQTVNVRASAAAVVLRNPATAFARLRARRCLQQFLGMDNLGVSLRGQIEESLRGSK